VCVKVFAWDLMHILSFNKIDLELYFKHIKKESNDAMQKVRSYCGRLSKVGFVLLLVCMNVIGQQQDEPKQQRPRIVATPTPPKQITSNNQSIEVDDGDVVRVDTQLVNVPTVVYDQMGRPLTNLKADNFIVYEDGQKQQLSNFATAETPFEVALLLDTSGSTQEQIEMIRRAAKSFISALREGDRVAIVAFNKRPNGGKNLSVVDVISRLTNNRDVLEMTLERIGASAGTPYYDGVARIMDEIFYKPSSSEMRGRRAIVALTDGVDSVSEKEFADIRARLQSVDVACYFIQVNTENFVEDRLLLDCEDRAVLVLSKEQLNRYRRNFDPKADPEDYYDFCRLGKFQRMDISHKLYQLARKEMNELSLSSGGKIFPVESLREAQSAFTQVAKEIGTQYSLGYYPTNQKRDGSFRTIRVEIKGIKGTSIRAREGYHAPKS